METIVSISDSLWQSFDYLGYYLHVLAPFGIIAITIVFLVELVRYFLFN